MYSNIRNTIYQDFRRLVHFKNKNKLGKRPKLRIYVMRCSEPKTNLRKRREHSTCNQHHWIIDTYSVRQLLSL